MGTNDKKLQAWLETVPDLDAVLEELESIDVPDIENDPEFQAELLQGAVTEGILQAMEEEEVNRNQLANKMGKSRQYVGRSLNEQANFTLKRLAEFAVALGRKVAIVFHKKNEVVKICPANSQWKPEREWRTGGQSSFIMHSTMVTGKKISRNPGDFQETAANKTPENQEKKYAKLKLAA